MTTWTRTIIYRPYTMWEVSKHNEMPRLLTSWPKGSNYKLLSTTVRTWHFELKLLIFWPDITLKKANECLFMVDISHTINSFTFPLSHSIFSFDMVFKSNLSVFKDDHVPLSPHFNLIPTSPWLLDAWKWRDRIKSLRKHYQELLET